MEGVALGDHGDLLHVRQEYDLHLAVTLYRLHDFGGAVDLLNLILDAPWTHPMLDRASDWMFKIARHGCEARPALLAFTRVFDQTDYPVGHPYRGERSLFRARAFVELGNFTEARKIFSDRVVSEAFPEFSAQCLEYLEGRPDEHVAAPTTLCSCAPQPSNRSQACECEPSGTLKPPKPTQPNAETKAPSTRCVCGPTGTECTRKVLLPALDDGPPFWSTESCTVNREQLIDLSYEPDEDREQ